MLYEGRLTWEEGSNIATSIHTNPEIPKKKNSNTWDEESCIPQTFYIDACTHLYTHMNISRHVCQCVCMSSDS